MIKIFEKYFDLPHRETTVGYNTIQTKHFDNQKTENMSNKQTAVEYLEEIYLTIGIDRNIHFWKAKEMEKEQISNSFLKGYDYCNSRDLEEQDDDFEFDFYEQTYGGNNE